MPHIITTGDGVNHTLFRYEDFAELVRKHLGAEAEAWITEYIDETYGADGTMQEVQQDHEKELEEIREMYQRQIREIRTESRKLAKLIEAEVIDRKAVSNVTGRIGVLTWEAVNRNW